MTRCAWSSSVSGVFVSIAPFNARQKESLPRAIAELLVFQSVGGSSTQIRRARYGTFKDLFEETLKDIYYAEKAILKALPKTAKKASSKKLQAAFAKHLKETEGQVGRLEKVFEIIRKRAAGKKCAAIEGIIEEAEEVMKEAEDDTIRDAAMLAAAQAVEHYEISRYGTLAAWAEKLELSDAAELLHETLEEEKATDEALTVLADSEINVEADEGQEGEDEDREERQPKRRAAGRR
jgi:ferritin-like metal-binding protein YciE